MKFELNDAVTILRGGIDGFPQVSLAGVPGRVCSTHPSALPGMISVWVDWSQTRYSDVDGLPGIINNFPADLGPPQVLAGTPSAKLAAKSKRRVAFHLKPLAPIHLEPELEPGQDAHTEAPSATQKPDASEGEDEAPPALRLV